MIPQVIITTVFGSGAEAVPRTFATFAKNAGAELHVFVFGGSLPSRQHPGIRYHLVEPDPRFVSVRRDALFRRWTLPDQLGAEFALVVDGTDVICARPLPPFRDVLRGADVGASPEWGGPVALPGVGYTGTYLNAGITFWRLPSSRDIREQIVERGRAQYRGPFDDQTALNEVILTTHFDRLTILPSQYNWRAFYLKTVRHWQRAWRAWPRVDSLDGVYLYHNGRCLEEVLRDLEAAPPRQKAGLSPLEPDAHPLSKQTLMARRLIHRWRHT